MAPFFQQAAEYGSDLIVFPEYALGRKIPITHPTVQKFLGDGAPAPDLCHRGPGRDPRREVGDDRIDGRSLRQCPGSLLEVPSCLRPGPVFLAAD